MIGGKKENRSHSGDNIRKLKAFIALEALFFSVAIGIECVGPELHIDVGGRVWEEFVPLLHPAE